MWGVPFVTSSFHIWQQQDYWLAEVAAKSGGLKWKAKWVGNERFSSWLNDFLSFITLIWNCRAAQEMMCFLNKTIEMIKRMLLSFCMCFWIHWGLRHTLVCCPSSWKLLSCNCKLWHKSFNMKPDDVPGGWIGVTSLLQSFRCFQNPGQDALMLLWLTQSSAACLATLCTFISAVTCTSPSSLYFSRPAERSGEDVDIILARLKNVKAFERFHPSLLQRICLCGFYECLEKGITCRSKHRLWSCHTV